MNEPVFIDASFWIAYRDEAETDHAKAKAILLRLFRERSRFVTTLPVLCEIHAYFSRNRRKRTLVLSDLWNNPLVSLAEVLHQDQESAIDLLHSHDDKTYPLCDAVTFVVMQRLAVRRVATFDEHFRQFGEFEIVA